MDETPTSGDDQDLLQEAIFQSLLRKLPEVADVPLLRETVVIALKMLLRHTRNQHLVDDLKSQTSGIIDRAEAISRQSSDPSAVQEAAKNCAQILRVAHSQPPPRVVAQAAQSVESYERLARVAVHPVQKEKPVSRRGLYISLASIVGLAVAGAYIPWPTTQKEPQIHPLVAQFDEALRGVSFPTNIYGGTLEVVSRQGKKAVVASDVPPAECVSAGWQLSHRGLVIVNDQPLGRPSAVIFSQYCHDTEAPVTMEWRPKAEK